MTKADLRTGMLIVLRNGNKYVVQKNIRCGYSTVDIIVSTESKNWNTLSNYNDDLTHKGNKALDIIKVLDPQEIWDVIHQHKTDYSCKYTVMWEENKERDKLNKVIKQLETDLQKAKEELKKIEGESK